MKQELVIGLDMGTTGIKAVVFNLEGKMITKEEALITTYYPTLDRAEQDILEIEEACISVMQKVIHKIDFKYDTVLTIGISAAMHSLICVDHNMNPLSPVLIWSDKRSSHLAESLITSGHKELYKKTGTPIHPMSPLLKLMWMKEEKYPPYEKASYFMSIKEYIIKKWFGERLIDYSVASATGLFNVKELKWEAAALALAGVTEENLSKIVAPTTVLRGLDQEIADRIGLPVDTPFVIGAADGQLANLGSGAMNPGEVNISVGTSGAIRQFVQDAPVNKDMETFTYAFTDDMSIIGGPTNNGGIVLQWLKDLIEFGGTHDELAAGAEDIEIGADGLLFLPYINGERAPLWNGHAKGNFYGLQINHHKDHLVRAVLEGIALNIYHISQSLEKIAGPPKKITVNGGLSKSQTWVQIMADIFGQDIYVSDTHHNAAWGAAWTALVGINRVDSFEAIKKSLPSEKVIISNQLNHEAYKKIFEKYQKLVASIEVFFK